MDDLLSLWVQGEGGESVASPAQGTRCQGGPQEQALTWQTHEEDILVG